MSERQKNRIMAMYYILVNSGARISDSMRKAVDKIENEKTARMIAGVKA